MFDNNKMIKVKKLKSGDVIFEITPSFSRLFLKNLIKFFVKLIYKLFSPIFLFFDKLAEKKKLVISSVGFGIGLALSIITTQRPDALQAFPLMDSVSSLGADVGELKIPSLDLYETVRSGSLLNVSDNFFENQLVHLDNSGKLGQTNPIVIADLGTKNLLNKIDEIKIGSEIIAIGKNKGIYKFKVIETREVEAEYLPHIVAKEEEALILYKSNNLLRTRLFVVVARKSN